MAVLVGAALPLAAAPSPQVNSDWTTYANGDDVWDLAFENANTIWAASRGGGVVRWDVADLTDPVATPFLAPQSGLPGNIVRAVVVDGRGYKWFATQRGLARLNPANDQWLTLTRASTDNRLPSDVVTALALDDDILWVGGQQVWSPTDHKWVHGGFARLDISDDSPTILDTWSADSQPSLLPSNNVTDIAVDHISHDVWLTFRNDIESITPSPERPNVFFRTRFGGITVVHDDDTLDMFRRADSSAEGWPKYDSLLTVAVDSQGLKWFGTGDLTQGGNGFEVLKGNTPATAQWKGFAAPGSSLPSGLSLLPSLPNNANRILHIAVGQNAQMWLSLAADTPNIDGGEGLGVCLLSWEGGFDGGNTPACALYNTTGGTTGQKLPGNLIRAFLLDPTRQVAYLGTSGRLAEVGDVAYSQGTEGQGIAALAFAPPKTTVLSTAALGLAPRSNHISALAIRSDRTVWVGGAYPTTHGAWRGGGLSALSPIGRWTHVELPNTGSRAVSSLAVDPFDRLWVGLLREIRADGTRVEGGVAYQDAPWTLVQGGSGFPLWSVSDIELADTRLWLGTGNRWPEPHGSPDAAAGLLAYDILDNRWHTPIQAPTIIANDVTAISARGAEVWIGNVSDAQTYNTIGGVSRLIQGGWTNYRAGENGLVATLGDVRAVFAAPNGAVWSGGYSVASGLPDPFLADAVINWRGAGETVWRSRTFKDEGWVNVVTARGNAIWVGLSRGGQNVEDFPARVFPAGQGNEYDAQGGLRVYVNGAWVAYTPTNSPLVSGHITALGVDPVDNSLWIGTTLGLMKYSGANPQDTRTPRLWLPLVARRD